MSSIDSMKVTLELYGLKLVQEVEQQNALVVALLQLWLSRHGPEFTMTL